jgi:hypothetical protein
VDDSAMDNTPTSRRVAFVLASSSLAVCVLGSMAAAAMFRGTRDVRILAWMALPLGMATAGVSATLGGQIGPIWFCTGTLFGFVVLAAWSLGGFYAAGALLMLIAAVAHLTGIRPRWRVLLAPLWLLAGVGFPAVVFWVRDRVQERDTFHIQEAPAVVWGGWLFLVMCGILLAVHRALAMRRRRV